jgi:hypothetical protein
MPLNTFLQFAEFTGTDCKKWDYNKNVLKNLNSVALVRERSIPTERPPLVGEVSDNV